MPFAIGAIDGNEKLKTPSDGDGNIVKLEAGQKTTVVVVGLRTEKKVTKISKDGKPSLICYLSIKDPASGEEGVMSSFFDTVFGKQMLHYFGNEESEGNYVLKPELKDATITIGKVAQQNEAGDKTYIQMGVEIVSQPNAVKV